MHVHFSGIEAVKIALIVVIVIALIRVAEIKLISKNPDSTLGQALAVIH